MLLRKILNKKNHVRYSGIKIDENLNWKTHAQELASKLNKRNSLLSKLRHFVSSYILRSVYFAIFQSHINYVCGVVQATLNLRYLFSKRKH